MRITGFGIIDQARGTLAYVSSGSIKTPDGTLPLRLKSIMDHLNEIITLHRPEHVAVEQVFVNVNPKSTLMLGQARGAAICTAVLNNLEVAEYTALADQAGGGRQWPRKKGTGSGNGQAAAAP